MRDFLYQIQNALDSGLYYLAVFACLIVPDICGAVQSTDGTANQRKYKEWFDKYVGYNYPADFTGQDCYLLRCSLLHQGTSQHHRSRYSRVILVEPWGNVIHLGILDDALTLDIKTFCTEILAGARSWLDEYEGTDIFDNNYSRFLRRYPQGLPPYILGIPVIS